MEQRTLWNTIEERRTRWIGNTLRQNGFVKNPIEGEIEGNVPRGRPRDEYSIEERRTRWIGHTLRHNGLVDEYNRRKNRGRSPKRKAKG
jgi:hypothetical protein